MAARVLWRHERVCFTPRTLDRLLEIFDVDTSLEGCWAAGRSIAVNGRVAGSYPRVAGARFHRWVLLLEHGVPLDDADTVGRHTCDNETCMRPDHILPGTRADNVRDALERGRVSFTPARYRAYWQARAIAAEARVAELEQKILELHGENDVHGLAGLI